MHKTAQNKCFYILILSQYMVESDGGCSHARTECAKKLVCEKPKTKLAESQFF